MAKEAKAGDKVRQFFSKYPIKTYNKGEVLILADENPQKISYIVSGHVRQYDISYRGDEVVVNVFKPEAFFPMSWAIAKTPNRYFFEAGENLKVHEAPPNEALKFLKENPDVALDLLTRLYRGVDGLTRRMAHLMGGSAKSRLLFEIIIECRRFGKKTTGQSYVIDMSESELGARSGLARETVSREIKSLKKLSLIDINRQGIIIKDINALENKLGPNL